MTPETLAWIERKKPELVGWAEAYVEEAKLFEATSKTRERAHGRREPHVKTSQLRNLLNAAQGGSPLAVILNFLRYQVARGRQGWAHEPSGKQLEILLREQLGPLCRNGVSTIEKSRQVESAEAPQASTREVDPYEIESHMAANLLGFIVREYTYRCAVEGTRP